MMIDLTREDREMQHLRQYYDEYIEKWNIKLDKANIKTYFIVVFI